MVAGLAVLLVAMVLQIKARGGLAALRRAVCIERQPAMGCRLRSAAVPLVRNNHAMRSPRRLGRRRARQDSQDL